jgi:hypothetical protein
LSSRGGFLPPLFCFDAGLELASQIKPIDLFIQIVENLSFSFLKHASMSPAQRNQQGFLMNS